jgi:hypothetical protein
VPEISSLPAFTYDWVGGDIHGLAALARQCFRIAPQLSDAVSALTLRADMLTCTAGWQGAAATAFTLSWEKDSLAGRQIASGWEQIGGIVDGLAVDLAALESVLERAAAAAETQGIVIDPGTGIPEPTITAAHGSAAARIAMILAVYNRLRAGILLRAAAVRAAAATVLQAIAAGMLPSPSATGGADSGAPLELLNNDLDLGRSLWAIPTVVREAAEKELPQLAENVRIAARSAFRELIAQRQLLGKGAGMPASARAQLDDALRQYENVQGTAASVSRWESPLSQLAAGDPAAVGSVENAVGFLARGLVKGVPYAATVASIYLMFKDDLGHGESVVQAAIDTAASNGAGLGGGLLVTKALESGPLEFAFPEETVGVTFGQGVTDFAGHLIQGDGVGQSFSDTAKDTSGLLAGPEHLLSGALHSFEKPLVKLDQLFQ